MQVAEPYVQHTLHQWWSGGEFLQFMHEALPSFEGIQALVVIMGYRVCSVKSGQTAGGVTKWCPGHIMANTCSRGL